MSEHDDTLLDEDLGDEEYDLGNDEEEALLADDYELERQSSYKGEEETDDVLDLGVTDALDDLDGEDENIEFGRSNASKTNENDFYEDGDRRDDQSNYYEQDDTNEYKCGEQARRYEERSVGDGINLSGNLGKGDLREKLQKNAKCYAGNGQGLEDDDCEEAKERRNRFQNERTIVSPKMNNNIPDTLENVVTSDMSSKMSCRNRGRGRATRGSRGGGGGGGVGVGGGGGRFNTQSSGMFNPRFAGMRNPNFDNQPPTCRPPLLETRPPFLLGVPNNIQNQQLLYQLANAQSQPFQHYSQNGPLQAPTHFVDNRQQFNPNQFQGQVGGPRAMGPRLDYGPRGGGGGGGGNMGGSLQGPSSYNCPPNQPPFGQIQPGPFQNTGVLMQENQARLMQSNQGPLLQGNPGGSLLGNPNSLVPGNPTPLLQGNQTLPMQGFPRQQPSSQGPPVNHPNVQIPNQSSFENRPPFQEAPFEGRPVYDSRPGYTDQVPARQFNSNALPVQQQPGSNVANVPLPPGHKILINPHFRGAVQPTNDARLAWDSAQQAPPPSQIPGGQFSQPPGPYQNQGPYNSAQHGPPSHYQQNYQQNKSDDPYAYFSDVWQENKPQKAQSGNPSKQYPSESNYSRESSYDCGPKYKSNSQWEQKDSYQEDRRGVHQSYRDRELSSKGRSDHLPKSRPPPSTYRDDNYEQNHTQKSSGGRSANAPIRPAVRLPQKRGCEPTDRPLRDLSPKRIKPVNRNLQEIRTVDTLSDASNEKKEEDSDPEMQEYRKKMEEQKRLREKILREKENRRKQAAMEKQNEEARSESNTTTSESAQQMTKPASLLMGVAKDITTNKGHPTVGKGRGRPTNSQATEAAEKTSSGLRIVRTIQTVQSKNTTDTGRDTNAGQATEHTRTVISQSGVRRVVIQKPLTSSQKIATSIQKTVSNLQKGQLAMQNKSDTQNTGHKMNQSQFVALKKVTTIGQKTVGNVTQKVPVSFQKNVGGVQETTNVNAQKIVVSTHNNQRVVLQKASVQQKKVPEIKTNTVKLENLAASTSEAQIRRMCQGIGAIESIQMGERTATIIFKTQSAAMVFHKKYQRKMLDLSLITVRLVPQPSGAKTTTAVVKVS